MLYFLPIKHISNNGFHGEYFKIFMIKIWNSFLTFLKLIDINKHFTF